MAREEGSIIIAGRGERGALICIIIFCKEPQASDERWSWNRKQ